MDKNRLIRIANHFDKIGAYTISDEFENKFLRLAAPFDRKQRNPELVKMLKPLTKPGKAFTDAADRAFKEIQSNFPTVTSILQQKQFSYNLILTWINVVNYLLANPKYSSDPKKVTILKKILSLLLKAYSEFESKLPGGIRNAKENETIRNLYGVTFANDNPSILYGFTTFVDGEDSTYNGITEYDQYINILRDTEVEFANLRNIGLNAPSINQPSTTKPTPSSGGPSPTPAGGSSTAPSASGTPSTPASERPSTAPSGGRPATTPSGGGVKPQPGKPQGKPSVSTSRNLSAREINEELSKIVYKKIKFYYNDYDSQLLFQDMKDGNKLKAYLLVGKDNGLRGSIIAAIKAKYDGENEDALLNKLQAKIDQAIEYTKPKPPAITEPAKPSDGASIDGSGTQNQNPQKPDTKNDNDPSKFDTFNFKCSREGLEAELKRMEALYESDRDKFMRDYSADITRVIKCHNAIRNTLDHKDNVYFDTFTNDIESKYFGYIYRRDLPY